MTFEKQLLRVCKACAYLWKSLKNGRTMKEQKRKKICDIAAELFAEKGFENTTTRDISKAAGMSDAGVYYYFDSKELLLYQIKIFKLIPESCTNYLLRLEAPGLKRPA